MEKDTLGKKIKNKKFRGATFSNKHTDHNNDDLSGEYVSASINMGESSRYINIDNLKEAYLSCNLGSLNAYFIGNELKNDITINVDCKLGDISIYLPKNWRVKDQIHVSLGDATVNNNSGGDSEFIVYLTGNVSLGNLDVYFN